MMYSNPYWQDYGARSGGGALAASLGCFGLMTLLLIILYLWLFYRIFTKAGYSGWLTLLNLIPYIGTVIVLFILALGDWPMLHGGGHGWPGQGPGQPPGGQSGPGQPPGYGQPGQGSGQGWQQPQQPPPGPGHQEPGAGQGGQGWQQAPQPPREDYPRGSMSMQQGTPDDVQEKPPQV